MCKSLSGKKTSPYLEEKLVYIGQMSCYEQGSEISKMLLNIEVSDSTIYRLTDKVGLAISPVIDSEDTRSPIEMKQGEILYVQCDGSKLLTREEKWKEVKLGRVFKSSSVLPQSSDRQWIRKSEYVAHLGHHREFEDLMSKIIDEPYRSEETQIAFVADGAPWQWCWVNAEYPQAIQILDFYHAMEHIGKYVQLALGQKKESKEYIQQLGQLLKVKGPDPVMKQIEQIPRTTKKKVEEFEKLQTYVGNNKSRMDYPSYIAKGLLIGSGAIESAHRTVLQKRLKLSGQRWSKRGMKNMIKLRSAVMSGYWPEILNVIRKAA